GPCLATLYGFRLFRVEIGTAPSSTLHVRNPSFSCSLSSWTDAHEDAIPLARISRCFQHLSIGVRIRPTDAFIRSTATAISPAAGWAGECVSVPVRTPDRRVPAPRLSICVLGRLRVQHAAP